MDLKMKLAMTPLYDWLGKRSYAQAGEDLIADTELDRKQKGFFVDIGAYHPKLFSNSYLFYKKGWRGLCIDPNPELKEMYSKARPEDKFLNLGVGEKEEVKEYFMFDDGAANTFSDEQAEKNVKAGRKMKSKTMVAILPLKTILEKYLPSLDTEIDLMSIDAEGMDEEILRSGDFKKFRPKIVIAEDLDFDFKNWKKSGIVMLMDEQGYDLKAKTPYSLIFKIKS